MAESKTSKRMLQAVIDDFIADVQVDNSLDMWISDSLAQRMTDAAWAVLNESRATQEWLKKEGHMR